MKQQLDYQQLLNENVAEGATTPNPGGVGVCIWSTNDNTVKQWNGTTWNAIPGSGVSSITGTASQVTASASTGAVTLSLPQSIATSSSPTFSGLSLSGGLSFSNAATVSAAGTTQGTATTLTNDTSVVTTCAAGAGVVLPSGTGREITVINRAANALLVYPPSGAAIDGAATNAAVSVPVNGWLTVDCLSSTQYFTIDPVMVGGTGVSITQSNNGTVTIANTLTKFTPTICMQAGDNNTYYFTLYATFPFTINGAYYQTTAGTITANIKIGTTSVTGLSALSLTTTAAAHSTATAANTVSVGNNVSVTFASNSSATYPTITLDCTRTG
jgi:hypothetical protein